MTSDLHVEVAEIQKEIENYIPLEVVNSRSTITDASLKPFSISPYSDCKCLAILVLVSPADLPASLVLNSSKSIGESKLHIQL